MALQFVHTSVPRGLVPGRSGFTVVGMHKRIRDRLVPQLERISGYEFSRGDRSPVVFSHRILTAGPAKYHILSQLRDAGTDYTGRTNYIAHHLVFDSEEVARARVTPSEVILTFNWLRTWVGEPRYFTDEEELDLATVPSSLSLPAETWAGVRSAEHAALLVENGSKDGAVLCYRHDRYDPEWILRLFGESALLQDPDGTKPFRSWDRTFTTCAQSNDELRSFNWLACPSDSPLAESPGRKLLIDLDDLQLEAPKGAAAEVAGNGVKEPAKIALPTSNSESGPGFLEKGPSPVPARPAQTSIRPPIAGSPSKVPSKPKSLPPLPKRNAAAAVSGGISSGEGKGLSKALIGAVTGVVVFLVVLLLFVFIPRDDDKKSTLAGGETGPGEMGGANNGKPQDPGPKPGGRPIKPRPPKNPVDPDPDPSPGIGENVAGGNEKPIGQTPGVKDPTEVPPDKTPPVVKVDNWARDLAIAIPGGDNGGFVRMRLLDIDPNAEERFGGNQFWKNGGKIVLLREHLPIDSKAISLCGRPDDSPKDQVTITVDELDGEVTVDPKGSGVTIEGNSDTEWNPGGIILKIPVHEHHWTRVWIGGDSAAVLVPPPAKAVLPIEVDAEGAALVEGQIRLPDTLQMLLNRVRVVGDRNGANESSINSLVKHGSYQFGIEVFFDEQIPELKKALWDKENEFLLGDGLRSELDRLRVAGVESLGGKPFYSSNWVHPYALISKLETIALEKSRQNSAWISSYGSAKGFFVSRQRLKELYKDIDFIDLGNEVVDVLNATDFQDLFEFNNGPIAIEKSPDRSGKPVGEVDYVMSLVTTAANLMRESREAFTDAQLAKFKSYWEKEDHLLKEFVDPRIRQLESQREYLVRKLASLIELKWSVSKEALPPATYTVLFPYKVLRWHGPQSTLEVGVAPSISRMRNDIPVFKFVIRK